MSHSSAFWKTQDQGARRFNVWWEPTSWFTHSSLLAVMSRGRRMSGSSPGTSFIRAVALFTRAPSSSPDHLPKAPPSWHWGLQFQPVNLGKVHKYSVYSTGQNYWRKEVNRNIQRKKKKKKNWEKKNRLSEIHETEVKSSNRHIIQVPKGKEKENGTAQYLKRHCFEFLKTDGKYQPIDKKFCESQADKYKKIPHLGMSSWNFWK